MDLKEVILYIGQDEIPLTQPDVDLLEQRCYWAVVCSPVSLPPYSEMIVPAHIEGLRGEERWNLQTKTHKTNGLCWLEDGQSPTARSSRQSDEHHRPSQETQARYNTNSMPGARQCPITLSKGSFAKQRGGSAAHTGIV